jgi:hypothetical protein
VTHRTLDALLAYWLGETDDAQTADIDAHLLACDECGASLDALIALGDGVRRAFDEGRFHAFVTAAFVERIAARGAQVREYRLPPGGSVACRVAPDDELLVTRLDAPLAGVTRLDAIGRMTPGGTEERFTDIPFDAARGQVVMVPRLAAVRRAPSHTYEVRLVAVDGEARRDIGRYTMNHAA